MNYAAVFLILFGGALFFVGGVLRLIVAIMQRKLNIEVRRDIALKQVKGFYGDQVSDDGIREYFGKCTLHKKGMN